MLIFQKVFLVSKTLLKNYDPFSESLDTPTQIGTAIVFGKSLTFMMPIKSELKVLDLRSQEAGTINIELLPEEDKNVTDKDREAFKDPEKLIGKKLSFVFKINNAKFINPSYEVSRNNRWRIF